MRTCWRATVHERSRITAAASPQSAQDVTGSGSEPMVVGVLVLGMVCGVGVCAAGNAVKNNKGTD